MTPPTAPRFRTDRVSPLLLATLILAVSARPADAQEIEISDLTRTEAAGDEPPGRPDNPAAEDDAVTGVEFAPAPAPADPGPDPAFTAPRFGFARLIRIGTDWWQSYRDSLEFREKVGDPATLEPGTLAALRAGNRDLQRFMIEWKARALAEGRVSFQDELTPAGTINTVEVYDAEAAQDFVRGVERTYKRYVRDDEELPDLMVYALNKNPHIRNNWRDGANYEQRLLDYGWAIGLGIIGYQIAQDKGKFKVDVKVAEFDEGRTDLEWRTRVSRLGASLEPDLKTGLLVERGPTRVEALVGGRIDDGSLRERQAEFRMRGDLLPLFDGWARDTGLVKWSSEVVLPLDDDPDRHGRPRDFTVATRERIYLTRPSGSGEALDFGVHVDTRDTDVSAAGIRSGWSKADGSTFVFGEANYRRQDDPRPDHDDLEGYELVLGVGHRW